MTPFDVPLIAVCHRVQGCERLAVGLQVHVHSDRWKDPGGFPVNSRMWPRVQAQLCSFEGQL